MITEISKIPEVDARKIIEKDESHFLDFKSARDKGKSIQKTIAAFANSDGGELYAGIEDTNFQYLDVLERWKGYSKIEDANQIVQTVLQDIKPTPPVELEFYQISTFPEKGVILKISVSKSSDVHYTSEGKVYVRRSAQNLSIDGDDIVNLKLSKGLTSYEDQMVSAFDLSDLIESDALKEFLDDYAPRTEPESFLRKQRLIRKGENGFFPTVAGLLLFSDNPSAAIPKKCAIKVSYYDTTDIEPERMHLKKQHTIEGSLIRQINDSICIILDIVQNIVVLGEQGRENLQYPVEAIKEILVNAIIHRDYNVSDDVIVLIFNNRIEIKNPGRLPGHITIDNILQERFARNPTIVRILNKYPDPPNKDIGEGLNTAFQRMNEMKLKPPKINISQNSILVTLPHERLAKPEISVMDYLDENDEISNSIARSLTGIKSENSMKNVFYRLRDKGLIEKVPEKRGSITAWRKCR
jgi:ATP-dependent DNA helicase RecG